MKKLISPLVYILTLILFLSSCSDKELLVDLEQDIFSGVGKWKIKKKRLSSSSKESSCDVTDLILNSTFNFKIYTSDNAVLTGTYKVLSPERIGLADNQGLQLGSLVNISVEEYTISFDIELEGVCQSSLEGEKDTSYEENKTYIADAAFENYLIEEGLDDVLDNFVTTSSILNVGSLNLSEKGITTLIGIEDFTNLEGLSAGNNQIEGVLDLSNNIKLINVSLPNNPITELYLKNNPFLENLWIFNTQTLETIEITNSPQLYSLTTHNNKLTEIDLKNSPNIFNLRIWDSNLKTLDLSFMSKLEYLLAWDTFEDSNEGEIQLPTNSSLKVVSLGFNRLKEVDISKTNKIERLDLDGNLLTKVDFSQNPLIEYLSVSNNTIEQLDLSPIQNLYWLRAHSNTFNCVKLREEQLNAIPPSCAELNLPDYSEQEEETCYNTGAWIEEDFFPRDYSISSSWVVDDGVLFSLDCN